MRMIATLWVYFVNILKTEVKKMSSMKEIYAYLPARFLASELDTLTDGVFRWRTIKNLRSKGHIPAMCFLKVSPRKILILRDAFLDWAEEYACAY